MATLVDKKGTEEPLFGLLWMERVCNYVDSEPSQQSPAQLETNEEP